MNNRKNFISNTAFLFVAFLLTDAGFATSRYAAAAQSTATYTYDNFGRLSTATYLNGTYPVGTVVQYSYDAAGNRSSQVITIPPPTATPITVSAAAGQTIPINVGPYVNDPLGYTLTVSGPSMTAYGMATYANTTITYTANANAAGQVDTFNYIVKDTYNSATSTVTVNITAFNVTISASTNNVVLTSLAAANGYTNQTAVSFTIANGVTIGSASTASPALDTGTWASGVSVSIVNNGVVQGAGGAGGNGGTSSSQNGAVGGAAGAAFQARSAVSFLNNGSILGGGGGGGGGAYQPADPGDGIPSAYNGGGGGGGQGTAGGNPGTGAAPTAGTASAPGVGGGGGYVVYGGNGGASGQAGAAGQADDNGKNTGGAGGAAGYAIVGNSYVTLSGSGAVTGPRQ